MDYLNQTIVFLSEENKELREKIRHLQQICKNITQTNTLTSGNPCTQSIAINIAQSELDQWQLSSPTSTKQSFTLNPSTEQNNMLKSQSTVQQFFSSSLGTNPNNNTLQAQTIENLQHKLHQLKDQLSLTTTQLHQTQLQSLNRTNKIKDLSLQLNRAKDQIVYLKKQMVKEKENLKLFYETTVVQEIEERFDQQRKNGQKLFLREKELIEGQLRELRHTVQAQQKMIIDKDKQLTLKHTKQQRMLSIISELKLLMESSSSQHQQQIAQLNTLLTTAQQQLTQLKTSHAILSEQFQEKQHSNSLLQFQVKNLKRQIATIKRQHERSLSKTERQLVRERSMSRNIEKQYFMERKMLQAELKKKQSNQKYHLKKEKELISKIKTIENGEFSLLNENSKGNLIDKVNSSNLHLSSLSSIDMTSLEISTRKSNYQTKSPLSKLNISNRLSQSNKSSIPLNSNKNLHQNLPLNSEQNSKPSFTKYLQVTPSSENHSKNIQKAHQKNKQRIISNTTTPKSVVKLKANTIGVINKDKNQSFTVTARTNKQSTPSTSRCHKQSQNKSIINSINLKDTKYHNQTVTEFSLTPNDTFQNNQIVENVKTKNEMNNKKSQNSSPFNSEESLEIQNYSSIDILKDNFSYFPSNKTSKTNSPHKTSPFQFKNNIQMDDVIQEEQILQQKFSFDEQIEQLRKLQYYMRTSFNPNHNHQQFIKSGSNIKGHYIMNKKRQTVISQFDKGHDENTPPDRMDTCILKRKQTIEQEQLIGKLLKTQQSNQKQHNKEFAPKNQPKNKPQQIEELLTSTQRNFKTHNRQLIPQSNTNQPFSFVSVVDSNQKPLLPVPTKKPIHSLCLQDDKEESVFKPNKDLMRLTDLDTPSFQSSSLINLQSCPPQNGSQKMNIVSSRALWTRQNLNKQNRISINIKNLNKSQTNLKR